jgi:hypothetical protein
MRNNLSLTSNLNRVVTASLVLFTLTQSAQANILGLYPAGAGCKSAAMETAGDCMEPQTLLYNPAVMSRLPNGFAGELGVARLDYSYEHPSYDPVHVKITTPMFTQGWKTTFAQERGTLGFAVMPGSLADLKINGLPRRVSGTVMPLNVRAKRQQFHIPVGGSYDFPDIGVSVGASLLYTYDKRSLKGAAVTEPNTPLVDMTASGSFFRPILGTTWRNESYSTGASFMFPVTKHFAGKTTIAGSPSFATEQVDYDPAVILLSARTNYNGVALSTNFNHIYGAKGSGLQRDGLNRATKTADLKDANHIGVRAGYTDPSFGELSLAAAYLDSYWGEGYYYKDADGFGQHEIGNLFGQFNAIPVHNQSITWRHAMDTWITHIALFRSSGTTTVSARGDNPGYYQIEFVSLTLGLRTAM